MTMLLNFAAFVVIIAGLKAAKSFLVPVLLALFLALICVPALFWLKKRRVPLWLGVLGLMLLVILLEVGLGTLIGTSVADLMSHLPDYQQRFDHLVNTLLAWLKAKGLVSRDFEVIRIVEPAKVMPLVAGALKNFGGLLSNTLFVLLTFVFMLFEAGAISVKVKAMVANCPAALGEFSRLLQAINRFIGVKTIVSLATGLLIGVWLSVIGLDYAVLWGLVAFLLNYIPTIGSFIAAVPALLLALLQLGFWKAVLVAAGYLVVNLLIGNVLEPRLMGQTVGLSPLVVFLSMTFWGWVLGPVGMLLSVPLTIMVKIAASTNLSTRWLAVLLGTTREAEALLLELQENRQGDKP